MDRNYPSYRMLVELDRQDFYATVYLSGLESLLTDTAQAMLDTKAIQYPQSVSCATVIRP